VFRGGEGKFCGFGGKKKEFGSLRGRQHSRGYKRGEETFCG